MPMERVIVEGAFTEDADLSNARPLRRTWDTTRDDGNHFGPTTLAGGAPFVLPRAGITNIASAVIFIRGRAWVTVTYAGASLPGIGTVQHGATESFPVDAGDGVSPPTYAAERAIVLGPFPTAAGFGWAAQDLVTDITITPNDSGNVVTTHGFITGT